jgi:organic radical activating enzyme
MNKYLENSNRIEFVVTMACSGKCKHCSQGSHISSDHIDADKAEQAIYDICKNYKIDSLMTFGGEPLLYPETVCRIHSSAKKMNIKQRDLITNGYFSKDTNRIKEVAHMLAESGVESICLSVDAFHQETIPLEYVKQFAKAVSDEGVSIHTHPAWLVSPNDDNPYNMKTREILKEFSAKGIEQSNGNVIFPSGNALKYLGEYFEDNVEFYNPYIENPKDIRTISFSANGDVLNGNIYNNSILEIMKSYDVISED